MRNNQSMKNAVAQVQEVCTVRQFNELNCRSCKYQGATCKHAIDYLKSQVERPNQIIIK